MDKVSIQFLFIFSLTKFVTSTSKLHFSQASVIYLLEKHHQATDEWTVRDKTRTLLLGHRLRAYHSILQKHINMPLPMKSATHINTLPVRPDLFGRKMNATTHHKQPQYVIASDCHVSISLSTLTYANFSSRQMLVALHQFKHLILYQLLLNNTVLYLMLFFIRWPGQILYKNRQFYFLTKLIKPQSQDGQLNH